MITADVICNGHRMSNKVCCAELPRAGDLMSWMGCGGERREYFVVECIEWRQREAHMGLETITDPIIHITRK